MQLATCNTSTSSLSNILELPLPICDDILCAHRPSHWQYGRQGILQVAGPQGHLRASYRRRRAHRPTVAIPIGAHHLSILSLGLQCKYSPFLLVISKGFAVADNLVVRSSRYVEQAFPGCPEHQPGAIFRSSGRLFRVRAISIITPFDGTSLTVSIQVPTLWLQSVMLPGFCDITDIAPSSSGVFVYTVLERFSASPPSRLRASEVSALAFS